MSRTSTISALLLIFIVSSAPATHVYKWVDEEGQVHYGQQKPAERQAEEIETVPAPQVDHAEQERRRLKQERLLEEFERKRQQKEQEAAADTLRRALRQEYCLSARRHLAVFESDIKVTIRDKKGRVRNVTGKERDELVTHWRGEVKKLCRPQALSFATFNSIGQGMTEDEVIALAGQPDKIRWTGSITVYIYRGTDYNPAISTIVFSGGIVSAKRRSP